MNFDLNPVEKKPSRSKGSKSRIKYVTVSIPEAMARDIDRLMEKLGYWPSRGAFVREACMDKIWAERQKLKELNEAEKEVET